MITNQIVPFRSVRRGPVHRAEVVRRGVRNCHQDKHRSRQIDIQPPHTTPRPVAYLCYYYTDTIIIIKIQERKTQQQQQKTTNKQTDQSLNISTNPRKTTDTNHTGKTPIGRTWSAIPFASHTFLLCILHISPLFPHSLRHRFEQTPTHTQNTPTHTGSTHRSQINRNMAN